MHSLKWALGKVQGTIFLTGDGAVRHTAGWLQAPRSSTGTVPVVKFRPDNYLKLLNLACLQHLDKMKAILP